MMRTNTYLLGDTVLWKSKEYIALKNIIPNESGYLYNSPSNTVDIDWREKIDIENDSIYCYSSSIQSISNIFIDIQFNILKKEGLNFNFNSGINPITIKKSGWYKIIFEGSANNITNSLCTSTWRLLKDSNPILEANSYAYHRNKTNGKGQGSITILENLIEDNTIGVQVSSSRTNSLNLISNTCRLIIEKV